MRAEVDTILARRTGYQAFEAHFREQAADPASPAGLVEFANWMIDTPKVVFSRSLSTLDNPSARLADADIPDAVASLKRLPGKGMVLIGGVSTVQQFVRHRLVDEYWIKVYPFALGNGQPVFTDLVDRARLSLVNCKAHHSGILTLRYQPA
jgi:dihydrofolate reductase